MSVADDKAEGFAWMLAAPGGTPEERAKIRAEREGWYRLDPLHIADLIPNYQRPRAPAEKMIMQAIEQAMREMRGLFEGCAMTSPGPKPIVHSIDAFLIEAPGRD